VLIPIIVALSSVNLLICLILLRNHTVVTGNVSSLTKDLSRLRNEAHAGSSKGSSGGGGSPEAFNSLVETTKKHDKNFSVIASTLTEFQGSVDKGMKRMDRDMVRIESLVAGMRDYLTESNAHITRLQEGYDYSVLKRVAKSMIQVANSLEGLEGRMAGRPEVEEIRAMWTDLVDAMEHNGIRRIQVKEGSDFAEIRKVAAAVPVKVKTQNPGDVDKVAEVISPGYMYVFNDDRERLILPAQVKLFEK
jgi:molecular chaperone GrpE (heat shock protein)